MNILEDGDLLFKDGDVVQVDEITDIKQELATVFNTWKGEFFLDENLGIEYDRILGKQVSNDTIMMVVADGISQVERITDIVDIDIERNDITRLIKVHLELAADENIFNYTVELGGV